MAVTQAARLRTTLVGTALVVAIAVLIAFGKTEWTYGRSLMLARASGWVAVFGLSLGLSLRPLHRHVVVFRGVHLWRRPVGICTALAAILHVGIGVLGPLDGAFGAVFTWPYLQAGGLALVILVLLLLTSFPRIVQMFKVRHWKVLHRLLYAATGLVILHLILSPWGDVFIKTGLCAVLGALLVYRVVRFGRE